MDRETETVINRLMNDLKAAQDLSDYLAEKNKKLREALQEISALDEVSVDEFQLNQWLHQRIARAALKENS